MFRFADKKKSQERHSPTAVTKIINTDYNFWYECMMHCIRQDIYTVVAHWYFYLSIISSEFYTNVVRVTNW